MCAPSLAFFSSAELSGSEHGDAASQGTNGGEAFQFGAARDAQTAADTSQLSGNVSTGAATFSFIQVLVLCITTAIQPVQPHMPHTILQALLTSAMFLFGSFFWQHPLQAS